MNTFLPSIRSSWHHLVRTTRGPGIFVLLALNPLLGQETISPALSDGSAGKVLESSAHQVGDRKIIIQKIVPAALPAAPAGQPATEGMLAPDQANAKPTVLVFMTVTAYYSAAYPGGVRTLFSWQPQGSDTKFEAWSMVDGSWLSGSAELEGATKRYALILGVGGENVDQNRAAAAQGGREFTPPPVPVLPQDQPSFVVTAGNPGGEDLAPLLAIQELFRTQSGPLRLAYEARETARLEEEAELKANPPKHKDIVLRYWRPETSTAADSRKGGAK